jgi:hypothetical protein
LTFGTPSCGLQIVPGSISVSDCTAAANQLLDAICTSGSCDIPPSGSVRQSVGTCTVLLVTSLGGNSVTFNEAPVQDAFPGFITECMDPTSGDIGDARGFPKLESTNGALSLIYTPSGPTSGG